MKTRALTFSEFLSVCSATDRRTQRNVAIKKITDAFAHATDTKLTLREAQLLRLISHENVIAIVDILPPVNVAEFDDVYVISELMAEILESQCPWRIFLCYLG